MHESQGDPIIEYHAALYTHFADRGALPDAVSDRWVNALEITLEAICRKDKDKDPVAKIHEWFQNLVAQHVHEKREQLLKQVLDAVINGLS